jgi:hypothetical protein
MPDDIVVGDVVRVTNPDPEYGCAHILAYTGHALRVVAVRGNYIDVSTKGVVLLEDTTPLEMYEVTKVDEKPFNEE